MREYGGFGFGGRKQRVSWLEDEIRHWHVSLGRIGDRLVEIETRYSFYLSRLGARYTGESATADQACGDAVNRAFILYEEATRLLEQAEEKVESAGPISTGPLDKAHELLTKHVLRVESGRGASGRRVDVPLKNSYEASGRRILHDLGGMVEQCVQALEDFRAHISRAMALHAEVLSSLENAENVLRERASSGAGAADTQERMEQHKLASAKLVELQRVDPIGASRRAETLLSEIRADKAEWRAGLSAVQILQDVVTPLAQRLQAEIEAMGEASDWNPTEVFDQARTSSREIKTKIDAGREEEALAQARGLEVRLTDFAAEVSELQNAKEGFVIRLQELRIQHERASQRVPEMREIFEKVGSGVADQGIVEETERVLGQASDCFARASAQFETGEYVSAWRSLDDVEALIRDSDQNYDELVALNVELASAQKEVDVLVADVIKRLVELQNSVSQSQSKADGVGRDVIESLRGFLDRSRQAVEVISARGQGWLRHIEEVRAIPEQVSLFEQMLKELRETFDSQRVNFERNTRRIEELIRAIEKEERDRAHVDQAGRALKKNLDEVKRLVSDPTVSGDVFTEHVQELRRFFEDTQEMWMSELSLVMQAETALARVRNHLNRIHARRFGNGVRANLNFAHQMLADVRNALESQRYDDAIRLALDLETRALAEETRCARSVSKSFNLYNY